MINEIYVENGVNGTRTSGEGFSPGTASGGQQPVPSRHQTTVQRRVRRKWSQEDNRRVMECYYQSVPSRNGYRKRMLQIWVERGLFQVTEQRLVDQANQIRKKRWLSDLDLELEEIRRSVEEGEYMDDLGQNEEDQEIGSGQEETTEPELAEQCMNPQRQKLKIVEGFEPSIEEVDLIEKLEEILQQERERLPSLRGINRGKLRDITKKVNAVLEKIETNDITKTNDLMYAGALLVTDLVGAKRGKRGPKKEPWWKRRLENQIKILNNDLGRVNALIQQKVVKRKHKDTLQTRYKIQQKGLGVVKEEIKQRIVAKSSKIKRYTSRITQYQQNRLFQNNQNRFYQELNGEGQLREEDVPDQREARSFWSEIWSKEVVHNKDAEWLEDFRQEMNNMPQQQRIEITMEKIQMMVKKIPNWKAPGPDMVQGYWFKNFTSMHIRLKDHYIDCVQNGQIPTWMTKGRTILIQKDKAKGNTSSNYRPITCLPIVWKILTGILAEEVYWFLNDNMLLPDEQKGCRKKTRGTSDLLYIDKMVLKEARARKKNLAMTWIDYRKAYDMMPHSWILECLQELGVNDKIRRLLEESMKSWRVELTCAGQLLGEVKVKRGIFQGDSLSPLLFVCAMIPLTHILRKTKPGYEFSGSGKKINHLLYMDDLKLYGKKEKELDSLVQTVRVFSQDIRMEFGIDKCAMIVLKRGKLVMSDGIKLPDAKEIKSMNEGEGYKYLGIIEADEIKKKEMKEKVSNEYKRRVRKILETKLSGENVIKAINSWAISLVRYSAAFLEWTKEEVQGLDRRTRKLLTMHKGLHPRSNVDRLYWPELDYRRTLIIVRNDCLELRDKPLLNMEVKRLSENISSG